MKKAAGALGVLYTQAGSEMNSKLNSTLGMSTTEKKQNMQSTSTSRERLTGDFHMPEQEPEEAFQKTSQQSNASNSAE